MRKPGPDEIHRFNDIQRVENERVMMIFIRNTIRRLLRAHEKEIKESDGVYDELWCKYKSDLRLANKLINEYDRFLDEQKVYHSNSHTEEDDNAEQTNHVQAGGSRGL